MSTQKQLFNKGHFDGTTYDPAKDKGRLTGQIKRVFACMQDGMFRTLRDIEDKTGDPQASISAQLRNLRKPRFGAHVVEKRRRNGVGGQYEYRLYVNTEFAK